MATADEGGSWAVLVSRIDPAAPPESLSLRRSRVVGRGPVWHSFGTLSIFSGSYGCKLFAGKGLREEKSESGEGGIRTPGGVSPTQHFQCCTIGRSVTSPVNSDARGPATARQFRPRVVEFGTIGI